MSKIRKNRNNRNDDDYDLEEIQKELTTKFEKVVNDHPKFKDGLIRHYIKESYLSDNRSPSILRCTVNKKDDGTVIYDVQTVVIYEYLEFIPKLRDAMNHAVTNNKIPILISFCPDKTHEIAFPVAMEHHYTYEEDE